MPGPNQVPGAETGLFRMIRGGIGKQIEQRTDLLSEKQINLTITYLSQLLSILQDRD